MAVVGFDLTGEYKDVGGYEAYIPQELDPDHLPFEVDQSLNALQSQADRAVARLDGSTNVLPDPDLFVLMYIRHEAVLSSRIEGTQSSVADVLEFEAGDEEDSKDVREVWNYVRAMRHGLDLLEDELPLSLRLIREIHGKLLEGVRGEDMRPGEFRERQNWVGPLGTSREEAEYVPPPPEIMENALHNLEEFIRGSDETIPPLMRSAVSHAQFETIHPFLDGNGRVGRLLIVFLLCQRDILSHPVLYISHYFHYHKQEYYERLQAIREDRDWYGWVEFFLRGVLKVSEAANETTESIVEMRDEHRKVVSENINSQFALPLLDYLYRKPYVRINQVKNTLGCSYPRARDLVIEFEDLGLLEEVTGKSRYQIFGYRPYVDVFDTLSLEG